MADRQRRPVPRLRDAAAGDDRVRRIGRPGLPRSAEHRGGRAPGRRPRPRRPAGRALRTDLVVGHTAGPGRLPADDIPNGKERALLRLVAEGCTDAAAAGQLHVSHRTARRMMAVLMERLGARSRFEAGVKAARRGWL
ncbi:helix-turn-helix transcriptional regulator [Streptomyces sp. B21-088]|uniref:helix-turn-helix transcriptional regulator n=1 Tax=Streptomyces sp. B21-088 TaxID=3039411 RepID=UPI002FF339FE